MRHVRTVVAIALCSVVGLAATAFAGYKNTQQVVVTATSAYGTMGSARNSADTVQYIGCSVTKGSGAAYATCSAKSSAGAYLSCSTTDPDMVAVAGNVNSISWVYFTVQSGSSTCVSLTVSGWSQYPPMVP